MLAFEFFYLPETRDFRKPSSRFTKGQVYPAGTHKGMIPILKREHAMVVQSRRSAPYHHVTMCQLYAHRLIPPPQATP